jgi:hypothetical protein
VSAGRRRYVAGERERKWRESEWMCIHERKFT